MDIKSRILRGTLCLTLSFGLLSGGVANATSSYQAVKNGSFEAGNTGWTDPDYCIFSNTFMYGSKSAAIGSYGVFENFYQKLYLPGNATSINLSFDNQYWDDVDYVGGYGAVGFFTFSWATAMSASFYDENDDTWPDIYTYTRNVTALKGKNIYLAFAVDNTGGYDNRFLVDNVSVIIQTSTPSPVYALSNKKTGSYYYTASSTTYSYLGSHGWSKKGEVYHSFKNSQTGLVPIYALSNKKTGVYYYTKSSNSYSYLGSHGWSKKGIAFRAYSSYKSNATAIYLLKNKTTGAYYYTKSSTSYNYLGSHGWTKKGVAFYAPK